MIYHIFLGSQIKHIKNYVLCLKRYSALDHFYIIVCCNENEKEVCASFLKDFGTNNYKIIILNCTNKIKKNLLYTKVWLYLLTHWRKEKIVFHGMTLRCITSWILLNLNIFEHIFVVNWGYVKIIKKPPKKILKRIATIIRNYIVLREIQAFHIIALMNPDKRVLKTYRPKSITCIPYPNYLHLPVFSENNNSKNVLLLGNSKWYIKSYIELLKKIPPCNHNMFLNVMYSYGVTPTKEQENELMELLNSRFNKKYYIVDNFLSLDKYFELIRQSTCYICNHNGQTGLGAIYTALMIGRDVFIKGHNYLWLKKIGLNIFSINDFIRNYPSIPRNSTITARKNRECIVSFLDPQRIISIWDKELTDS